MSPLPDLRIARGAVPIDVDVVHVEGPEAIEYLQGQLSQDIAGLAVGGSAPSLLLQPTGKVDAWLRVVRLGEHEALLVVDAGFGELVVGRLQRFRLRTKVELSLDRWSGVALRGPGSQSIEPPAGSLRLVAGWPGVDGVDLLGAHGATVDGEQLVDHAALEALRIECGVPAMGAELTDATIPAEAGQWLIDASVSFTKGCYTGQELVARIDSRGGNVPHPIRGVLVDGEPVPAGTELELDGAVVGRVTSTARSAALGSVALAVVPRSVSSGTRAELVGPAGRATGTIRELPLR